MQRVLILLVALIGITLVSTELTTTATATAPAGQLNASQITVGVESGCAMVSTKVQCWGQGVLIGNATAPNWDHQSTPVDVCGSQPMGWNCSLLTGAVSVTSGPAAGHTCAMISGGGLKCWGVNDAGEIGNGTVGGVVATPVSVCADSSCSTSLGGVQAVATGKDHTCAIVSGGVKCWGFNAFGQLGNGTTTNSSTPVQVSGLTSGVTAISGGGEHSCAIQNGGLKCWGYNDRGQVGDGSTTNRLTPVDVVGLTSGVASVKAGGYNSQSILDAHTCALTTAAAMKCWGYNGNGQLGNGTNTNSSTPVDVNGLSSGVTAITVGTLHSCALLNTQKMKCWGYNPYGEVGDGTTGVDRNVPVDVCAVGAVAPCGSNLLSNVVEIGAGYAHTCARLSDGSVRCWGYNNKGELGNGESGYSEPVAENVILDTDRDGCPDVKELQTAVGSETSGGRRDPNNSWDYFNPTMDGLNRIDDTQKVQSQYFIDYGNPNYTRYTDRTSVGPNPWNLGPPNGFQRIDDIIMVNNQYFHDCGLGQALLPPWP